MTSSSYKTLNVTAGPDGHVVTVELSRPDSLNAMNTAMGEDLLRCFEAFQWDRRARCVVFTGAGAKAFCVGGDLKEREGMTDETWRAQHLGGVLAEQGRHAGHAGPLAVPAHGQPDRAVIREPRMLDGDEHAAGFRLGLRGDAVERQDGRARHAGALEPREDLGAREPARDS